MYKPVDDPGCDYELKVVGGETGGMSEDRGRISFESIRPAPTTGFPDGQAAVNAVSTYRPMQPSNNIAFKEWAVVVDALAHGEQVLILRKGGICEDRGQFRVDHGEFWLFPTQYHEAERCVIPSKRPRLREIASAAPKDGVNIDYYAVADAVVEITGVGVLKRLQGRHIWTEQTLQERFQFGRNPGLHVLVMRVYRRPTPEKLALREQYGGCRSWLELEHPLSTESLTPVLRDAEYTSQRDAILEILADHALAHS